MKKEESLQIAVSTYLKLQFPKAIFTSESSGLRLPIGLAKKAKAMRSSSGLPDLIVLHPMNGYHGLCLELKATSPFKKDGSILKDEHLIKQAQMLMRLSMLGYKATFATGIDEAKSFIDEYFKKL